MITIADIRAEFEKYIVLNDPYIVDMILATVVGNMYMTIDPIWLMIVSPPSSGKSTLMAPLRGLEHVSFLDDLTEKTFLSAYTLKGKECSLLKLIGDGIICFSDFTTILAKNPLMRGEILAQLRLVYDGNFVRRTGKGEVSWSGRMGAIAAATPDIYGLVESARSMGERFMYFCLDAPPDQEVLKKLRGKRVNAAEMASEMAKLFKGFLSQVETYVRVHGVPELVISDDSTKHLEDAALFCVNAKSTVHLDYKTGKPDALANKPSIGRDYKMMINIAHALQLMERSQGIEVSGLSDNIIGAVERCAWSSVSPERRKILEILAKYDTTLTASEIGATDNFGIPKESVEKYLHALHSSGLINKEKKGSAFGWLIKDEAEKAFIRQLCHVEVATFKKDDLMPVTETESTYPDNEDLLDGPTLAEVAEMLAEFDKLPNKKEYAEEALRTSGAVPEKEPRQSSLSMGDGDR